MTGRYGASIAERISRLTGVPDENGCTEWLGATNGKGYGKIQIGKKNTYVHRLVYELENGHIASGNVIDHLCRNRACINPKHLEAVTQRENVMRGSITSINKARAENRKECKRGHEVNAENYAIRKDGNRYCKVCANLLKRKRYQREVKNGS